MPASHRGRNNGLVYYHPPRAETIVDSAVGGAQGFGMTPPSNHRSAEMRPPSSSPLLLTVPDAHGHGHDHGHIHGQDHYVPVFGTPPSSSAHTVQSRYHTTTPSSPFEREFQIGRLGRDTSAVTTAGLRSGTSAFPVAADGGSISRPLPNTRRLLFPRPAAPAVPGTGRTDIGTLPPLPPHHEGHSTIIDDGHPIHGRRHQLPTATALSTMAGTQPPVAPSDTTVPSIRPQQQHRAPDYSSVPDHAGASGGGGGEPSALSHRQPPPPPPPNFILEYMSGNATGTTAQEQQQPHSHHSHHSHHHTQREQLRQPQPASEMQKQLVIAMSAGIKEAGELAKQRRNLKLGPRSAEPLLHGVDRQIRTLHQRMEDMEERLGQGAGSSWVGWTASMWDVFFKDD